ncbi:putative 2-hydroxyacyl-CoA lyase 1, partial [Dissostichus eleginoides]
DPCFIDHRDVKSVVQVSGGLFVFINCNTCILLIGKLCAPSTLPRRRARSGGCPKGDREQARRYRKVTR